MNNTGQKFGGRKAGTPNKKTAELRDKLMQIVQNQIDIVSNSEDLSIKDRIDLIGKLIGYVLPKPIEHPESSHKPRIIIRNGSLVEISNEDE